jgi:hypothetical protein
MTTLRPGVAIGALVGYALYAATSVFRNGSLVRVDVSRELVLATFFVILLTALAPVIADSVGRTHTRGARIRAAGFWVVVVPLNVMFTLAMILIPSGGSEYVIHYTTYCAWVSGSLGGVSFATWYAYRTAFVLPPSRWRTRVLVGAGVITSAIMLVFMVPFSIVIIGMLSLAFEPPADEFVLPESFRGMVRVTSDAAAPLPATLSRKTSAVHYVPPTGEVRTNLHSRFQGKVFSIDSTGARTLLPTGRDEECRGALSTLAPPRTTRDVVCWHGSSPDGDGEIYTFTVIRAHKPEIH